jgi:hypothetical protein
VRTQKCLVCRANRKTCATRKVRRNPRKLYALMRASHLDASASPYSRAGSTSRERERERERERGRTSEYGRVIAPMCVHPQARPRFSRGRDSRLSRGDAPHPRGRKRGDPAGPSELPSFDIGAPGTFFTVSYLPGPPLPPPLPLPPAPCTDRCRRKLGSLHLFPAIITASAASLRNVFEGQSGSSRSFDQSKTEEFL